MAVDSKTQNPVVDLIINQSTNQSRLPSQRKQLSPVHNPANPDEVVGHVVAGTRADARAAIDAAERAFPAWSSLSFSDRARYLRLAAERIEQNLDERVTLLVKENGKVRREAGMDFARLIRRVVGTADEADTVAVDEHFPPRPRASTLTHLPLGVVGLIVPWNWPLSILGAKLPQALLAGDTVVVKPSPLAPLATMQTLRIIADALPLGVVNAVTGGPDDVGAELLADPRVRKIDFTGSTESGRAVMAAAAPTLKRLTLELGGNDPAIVLADAEISPETIGRMIAATFMTTGQTCMAIKRMYVHHSRFAEVVDALRTALAHTVVGDGLDPESTMGPLISAHGRQSVVDMVAEASARGARVHELGRPLDPKAFAHGHFLLPTLITDVDHSCHVVSREQFGPTLPIMSFRDEQAVLSLANDFDYGLCSSVWTTDIEHGLALARQLYAGTTHINHHGPAAQDDRLPFGGVKGSGMGRELGVHGIREFMDSHTITITQ